jgi:hypothetical protein
MVELSIDGAAGLLSASAPSTLSPRPGLKAPSLLANVTSFPRAPAPTPSPAPAALSLCLSRRSVSRREFLLPTIFCQRAVQRLRYCTVDRWRLVIHCVRARRDEGRAGGSAPQSISGSAFSGKAEDERTWPARPPRREMKLSARVHGGYEYGVDTDMHMDRPLATKLVSRRPASPRSTVSIYSPHNHTLLVHLVLVKCLLVVCSYRLSGRRIYRSQLASI